jgi:lipopolysaccharide transport system ATP-binding protein
MSDIAITVSGLGKRYRIGAQQMMYRTLREKLNDAAMAPFRSARRAVSGKGKAESGKPQTANGNGNGNGNGAALSASRLSPSIWALKDVSFEIKRGEVVGIIGRNGAGKSTLLKILSRITEPTEGYADINGRIASLLEVGTGFHPELTGRENIFLNGSILGMKRAEIIKKFDEIVAFSEIDKFIDTAVKYYSSGMYVRLAFAVAAHLDPEILLVDEVLAVGDVGFQEKCLGKIGDVAKQGRTVLFVSHNLGAIQRLCGDAILIDRGQIEARGKPVEIAHHYLGLMKEAPINDKTRLWMDVRILDVNGNPTMVWKFGQPLVLEVLVSSPAVLRHPSVDIGFYTGTRARLFSLRSDQLAATPTTIRGEWKVRFEIHNPGFTAPEMIFDVGLREGNMGYRKLVSNAGSVSADYETFPQFADLESTLFAEAGVTWEEKLDSCAAIA